jgi:hypothetical protein
MDVILPDGLDVFLANAGWGDAVIEPLRGDRDADGRAAAA